jgi:hypothetical protein
MSIRRRAVRHHLLPAAGLIAAAWLAIAGTSLEPEAVIRTGYHLTARPWKPLDTPAERYLDVIEGLCRFSVRHQDAGGAIIDPFLKREHQYATPYFAYAVGTLIFAGRARDLLPSGVKAMEHSTANFAGGRNSIPDQHGEFFVPALTEALDVYAHYVPAETLARWRERLRKPRSEVVRGSLNNWETYAMKGEWLRSQVGLADQPSTVAYIEAVWRARQSGRFAAAPWFLYHDRTSDPDTLSVEAVGRGNLLALVQDGYDGPSAGEMRRIVEAGTRLTLDLQDPSGQAPANGRTDDHVWVDVGYQLGFEVMAGRAQEQGNLWLASQYRHAAMLSFQSIQRWKRTDGDWSGSYFITKNRFDPELRVGYQLASQYSNYSGSLMFHLAEAWHVRQLAASKSSAGKSLQEHPAPNEIGGYAIATDPAFAAAFANAGGMQMEANLRGQAEASDGNFWTPLGVVRFARTSWDTRLGPSDGALTEKGGVSFAPEFFENGKWLRMADLSTRYEGIWSVQFVHPLLVRCAVEYQPKAGRTGPTFRDEFIVTPDGVLSTITSTSRERPVWGVSWPLLENDGTELDHPASRGVRSVKYPGASDQQNFIAMDPAAEMTDEPLLRSTYGDLRPIRVLATRKEQRTFVYPQGEGDPTAKAVHDSLAITPDGFRSVLARVSGTTYIGRTAAGGYGTEIDLDGDGVPEVTFAKPCGFLLVLRSGKAIMIEADRDVEAGIQGRMISLLRYQPSPLP